MSEKLLVMHQFLKPEDSNGLKSGDMLRIKKTGKLVRYVGVSYGGIPDTPYNKKLLLFSQPVPVHPFNKVNQEIAKTYYLATEESSSQGFIDPLTIKKCLEGICFLNKDIENIEKDFEKVGNIPHSTWFLMEQEAPRYSVNEKIQ